MFDLFVLSQTRKIAFKTKGENKEKVPKKGHLIIIVAVFTKAPLLAERPHSTIPRIPSKYMDIEAIGREHSKAHAQLKCKTIGFSMQTYISGWSILTCKICLGMTLLRLE
jgi:hypothetical protein